MTKKPWICGLLLVVSASCSSPDKASERPPNVVLIFMDDMGNGDLSCTGALDYETPTLDDMASRGLRLTNFLAAQAVCSASRAGLLTGCYPNRIGISGALFPGSKIGLNREETTLAELFKQKDYATALVGKWHLGENEQFLPLQHGFDEYFGIPYSNDMWPVNFDGTPATEGRVSEFPPLFILEGYKPSVPIRTLDDQAQITKHYTERAVQFISSHKEKPFFLYLAHNMPHVPINASPAFKGKSSQGLYGDVMMEIDWSVGEIMKALAESGLEDNTLIIFTSDNGPWLNFGNHAGSTGGLREGKGTSYEGGQRVPCIMYWKGKITPGISGSLMSTIDLFPTLAELIGASLPERKIDGISMMPLVRGDYQAEPRTEFLYYFQRNNLEAVRKGNWKLVLEHPTRTYEANPPGADGFPGEIKFGVVAPYALYDLRRDPGERYDVKDQHPDLVKELQGIADQARLDLGDDLEEAKGAGVRPVGTVE